MVLEDYLREVARHPVLPHDQQVRLAVAAQGGDQDAEHALVRSNLRLVLAMAVRYRGRGLPLADLVQEGNHGLMQAVSRFDPGKEVRFSTYALWWIRQSLERSVANQSRTIRLPIHFRERITRIRRAREDLSRVLGRDPSLEELAERVHLAPHKVRDAVENQGDALSLDVRAGEESEGAAFQERVPMAQESDPGRFLDLMQKRREVRTMLGQLDPKERTVLERRYGLQDGRSRTLEEVGKTLRITRERVRQIEAKALQKLRTEENKDRVLAYVQNPV